MNKVINYTLFPALAGVFLEDSFVLDIEQSPGKFAFHLEAVLTPDHPLYHDPRPGEQHCYADGDLIFQNPLHVLWLRRSTNRYIDAAGQEDLGNIDSLTVESNIYHVEGDWGTVKIESADGPRFEIRAKPV